jgi:hypothetical protein
MRVSTPSERQVQVIRMNDTTTHPAAELDPDAALLNDPFLIGLDRPAQAAPISEPDAAEAARLAAARAMLRHIETQASDPSAPVEAPLADPWETPSVTRRLAVEVDAVTDGLPEWSPEPASPPLPEREPVESASPPDEPLTTVVPDGAIVAANGQPFRDADAARFKAARLAEETGEPFDVRALSAGGFVVVHSGVAASPLSVSTAPPVATPPVASAKRTSKPNSPTGAPDLEHLSIDSFPEGHPARKYGLPLYKSILSQTRKPLRQAWRSQLPLLVVAVIGLLIFLAPEPVVSLAVPPASAERLVTPSFVKGVGFAGLALALFVLGKVLYIRINYRFYLTQNYAKSESGIIARRATKLVYGTILATDTHQSVLGRLLNFGTVELSCAGSDGNEILIENVYAPEVVQAVIESRMIEMRAGTGYR